MYVCDDQALTDFTKEYLPQENQNDSFDLTEAYCKTNHIALIYPKIHSVFGYIYVNAGYSYETIDSQTLESQTLYINIFDQQKLEGSKAMQKEVAQTSSMFETSTELEKYQMKPLHQLLIQALYRLRGKNYNSMDQQQKGKIYVSNDVEFIETIKDLWKDSQNKEIAKLDFSKFEPSLHKFGYVYHTELASMAGYIGAMAAYQAFQILSKRVPIYQFYTYDRVDLLPITRFELQSELSSYYYDMELNFGHEIMKRLSLLKLFIPGSGALGCEALRLFALMGIANNEGRAFITDFDLIEHSNLNRQQLYSNDDVGKSKSLVAAANIRKINPRFNVTAFKDKVTMEIKEPFTDEFWEQLDFVLNGLDNVKGRNIVQEICKFYDKTFIDCGIQDSSGQYSIFTPKLTKAYKEQEQIETTALSCTTRIAPTDYKQCIQWAAEVNLELFELRIKQFFQYIQGKYDYSNELTNPEFLDKLQDFEYYIQILESMTNDKECVSLIIRKAYMDYDKLFNKDIVKIQTQWPEDHVISETGQRYWEPPKNYPQTLVYDSLKNEYALSFMIAATKIYMKIFGCSILKEEDSLDQLEEEILKYQFEDNNDQNIHNEHNSNMSQQYQQKIYCINKRLEELTKTVTINTTNDNKIEISSKASGLVRMIEPSSFDKNDFNHLLFLYAAGNLKCQNYHIPMFDFNTSTKIGAKIEGQLSHVSSAIVSLASLEIINYAINNNRFSLTNTNSGWFDFEGPNFSNFRQNDPDKYKSTKDSMYAPYAKTIWDKLLIDQPLTVKELRSFLNQQFPLNGFCDAIYSITLEFPVEMHISLEQIQDESMTLREVYQEINQEKLITTRKVSCTIKLCSKNYHKRSLDQVQYNKMIDDRQYMKAEQFRLAMPELTEEDKILAIFPNVIYPFQ